MKQHLQRVKLKTEKLKEISDNHCNSMFNSKMIRERNKRYDGKQIRLNSFSPDSFFTNSSAL